jgi:ATP-dependent Zn protease
LLQLADALIRYETLTGEEVQDLIKGKLVKKDYDALSGPSI